MLVNEVFNGHEAATNLDLRFASHDLDSHTSCSIQILPFLLTVKHNLEFGLIRVSIHEFSKANVRRICLNWDVVCEATLKIHYVLLEHLCLLLVLLFHSFDLLVEVSDSLRVFLIQIPDRVHQV